MFSRLSLAVALLFTLPCLDLVPAAQAAPSPYQGIYYSIGGDPDGFLFVAANIEVSRRGVITGAGIYVDGVYTSYSGQVYSDGSVTLNEDIDGEVAQYTGKFKRGSTNKFVIKFDDGTTFKSLRVPTSFPVAGLYVGDTEGGELLMLVIDKKGNVFGAASDEFGNYELISGDADEFSISAEAEDGILFDGDIDGDTISGTYYDPFDDTEGFFDVSIL